MSNKCVLCDCEATQPICPTCAEHIGDHVVLVSAGTSEALMIPKRKAEYWCGEELDGVLYTVTDTLIRVIGDYVVLQNQLNPPERLH